MNVDFCIGNITISILFHHGAFAIVADSSISPDSCIIADIPDLDANGRYLIDPTITNIRNDFCIPQLCPIARKATPRAIEGIKYGRKAKLSSALERNVPLFLATA